MSYAAALIRRMQNGEYNKKRKDPIMEGSRENYDIYEENRKEFEKFREEYDTCMVTDEEGFPKMAVVEKPESSAVNSKDKLEKLFKEEKNPNTDVWEQIKDDEYFDEFRNFLQEHGVSVSEFAKEYDIENRLKNYNIWRTRTHGSKLLMGKLDSLFVED